ncbi:hypothetical protein TRVA0_033S01002 [Trichomonascus vanleenenianus]|uniref:uncharacterized protein n=1 Tax=Trichomonascus vanleenenianus TaxID=2268995 RepID=UPI003EC977DD
MDYTKLRKDISLGADNEETVAVNHRALITRTLTKYPVDYALYRELLQNSADARASNVVISFETSMGGGQSTSTENIAKLHEAPIVRLTVKNNGQLFEEEDWSRLREIAKGNPNEAKIGAFGVGFYSVFEVTDEPLVHSGKTVMSFYYVGDQLRYRRETTEESSWTVIDLPYRSPGVLPNLLTFTAFLAQSFMLVSLSDIDLQVDGVSLLRLKKISAPTAPISIPSYINTHSLDRTLNLKQLGAESIQVTVKYMNVTQLDTQSAKSTLLNFGRKLFASFVTSSSDPTDYTEVTCFLQKVTARVAVSVSSHFAKKMKETVMKAPSKEAILSMLTNSREENELSELKPPLRDYIYPKDTNDAKIYIGFPTKQSTGIKSHIAMNQLIPTMERTAIDMSNAFVKTWNEQMLYMAGVVSRVIYENEMAKLSNLKTLDDFLPGSIYTMDRFTVQPSTPDAMVGQWIAGGFYKSCTAFITVPSQLGIKRSSEVRIALGGIYSKFIKSIPILPESAIKDTPGFIDRAKSLKMIRPISPEDILQEVKSRTLSVEDMKLFIRWCAASIREGELTTTQLQRILSETIATDGKDTVQLSMVRYYQPRFGYSNLPLPPSAIKNIFTNDIPVSELEIVGWKELTILPWVSFVAESAANSSTDPESNIQMSSNFAIRVLTKIDKEWYSMTPPQQQQLINLLSPLTCILTQLGMKTPPESYLVEIPMFPNLPVKVKELDSVSNHFLFALGMRESVDMAFVLKLLHEPKAKDSRWSTYDVVKYLTAHEGSLKKSDWELLHSAKFFEAEDSGELFNAFELYAPDTRLKELGFRTLKWKEYWQPNSKEAHLLYRIGLKKFPSAFDLLLKGDISPAKAKLAVKYFLDKFHENKYSAKDAAKVGANIVPCKDGKLYAPAKCYIDIEAEYFDLPVVVNSLKDMAWMLGVSKSPSTLLLTQSLITNLSKSFEEDDKKFSYFASRLSEVSKYDAEKLRNSRYILVNEKDARYQFPKRTFLGARNPASQSSFFRVLLDYVHPSSRARIFLDYVGARDEPSIAELADMAASNPNEFYQLAGGRTRYEQFLGQLATGWDEIKLNQALVQRLKRSSLLIGIRVTRSKSGKPDDEDDDIEEATLVSSFEVAIVDDVISYNRFKQYVYTAPQVSEVEEFYKLLGVINLSSAVAEQLRVGRLIDVPTDIIKKTVIERGTLFLKSRKALSRVKASELHKLVVQQVGYIEMRIFAKLGAIQTPIFKEESSAIFDTRDCWKLYVTGDINWFDLAKALVSNWLKRPDTESVFFMETLLSSKLNTLKRKGINVDRLLKEKERERQRIMENQENERRVRELEQTQIQEKARKEQEERAKKIRETHEDQTKPIVEAQETEEQQTENGDMKRQTGIDPTAAENNSMVTKEMPTVPFEPSRLKGFGGIYQKIRKTWLDNQNPDIKGPSNPLIPNTPDSVSTNSVNRPPVNTHPPTNPIQPSSPTDPMTMLQKGLDAAQTYSGKNLKTSIYDVDGQQVHKICNPVPSQDLEYRGRVEGGPSYYIKRGVQDYSEAEITEIRQFKPILQQLAKIYTADWNSFHVFLDRSGSTIAFNLGGSLFFNLSYFMRHMNGALRTPGSPVDVNESLDYWYPIIAHELAHSIVAEHGAMHSFYTESYIQHFLARFKAETG